MELSTELPYTLRLGHAIGTVIIACIVMVLELSRWRNNRPRITLYSYTDWIYPNNPSQPLIVLNAINRSPVATRITNVYLTFCSSWWHKVIKSKKAWSVAVTLNSDQELNVASITSPWQQIVDQTEEITKCLDHEYVYAIVQFTHRKRPIVKRIKRNEMATIAIRQKRILYKEPQSQNKVQQ